MTNEEIITKERNALAEQGKIKLVTIEDENGEFVVPEEIHTYATWKKLGFTVKKGQKAVAKFKVWRYSKKKVTVTDEETNEPKEVSRGFTYLTQASFFSATQVEAA